MEIRGIGIIDIRAMYGVGAVALSKTIDLVMHMEKWVDGKEYDRLGLSEEYITILGVKGTPSDYARTPGAEPGHYYRGGCPRPEPEADGLQRGP